MIILSWLPTFWAFAYKKIVGDPLMGGPDQGFVDEVLLPFIRFAGIVALFWTPRGGPLGRVWQRYLRLSRYYGVWRVLVAYVLPAVATSKIYETLGAAADTILEHLPDKVGEVVADLASLRWTSIAFMAKYGLPFLHVTHRFTRAFFASIGLLVLLVSGTFEVVWWLSCGTMLAMIWGLIYRETIKSFCACFSRNRPVTASEALLRRIQVTHKLDQVYRPLQESLDSFSPPPFPLRQPLSSLLSSWLALTSADDVYLSTYADHCRALSAGTNWATPPTDLAGVTFDRLSFLVNDECLERPSPPLTSIPTLRNATYELTGIVVNCLLPFPHLKHLSRPFRLKAFLPFLISYPAYMAHVATQPRQSSLPAGLRDGPARAWSDSLDAYLSSAQNAGMPQAEIVDRLEAFLRCTSASARAVSAEDKAREAILEAILLWKERKNELEKKRFKQD